MKLNKKGDIGMLIVDIIFGFLIVIMLFVFSLLFKATVDTKYERIEGILASESARLEVFSLLHSEYQQAKISDRIVAFCSSNKDLKEAFGSIKGADFSIKILCPDKKEFKIGDKQCQAQEDQKVQLISEKAKMIQLRYC